MIKLTALYGHPTDPAAFENYYGATHMPLVAKMSGLVRHEKSESCWHAIGTSRAWSGV
jgi:uncharacterized protein (TIGR02118 family)